MQTQWISAPHDRPRCRANDTQGWRCRQPVVWDEATNRPLSTRCERHGGLADAAFMGCCSPDVKEPAGKMTAVAEAVHVLATSVQKLRTLDLGRPSAGLFALALAGALCLTHSRPALADFETAVTAYQQGAYQEALTEFQDLAEAGDTRAMPYLEKIRQKLKAEEQAKEPATPTLMERVTSIFEEPDRPKMAEPSTSTPADTLTTAAGQGAGSAAGHEPADWTPWSPSDESNETAPPPPATDSDIVVPQRDSIWSSLYHLPGDATVIGLQYVAKFVAAYDLDHELQLMSRHSDQITLSILAGFWWLVIVRGLVGIGIAISRFMKAAATIREGHRYG